MSAESALILAVVMLPLLGALCFGALVSLKISPHQVRYVPSIVSLLTFSCASVAAWVIAADSSSIPISVTIPGWEQASAQVDELSLIGLMLISGLTSQVFIAAPSFSNLRREVDSSEQVASICLLGVAILTVLVDQTFTQWMLVCLAGWLLVYAVAVKPSTDSPSRWRTPLVLLTIADLAWMIGLQQIEMVTQISSISHLTSKSLIAGLSEIQLAFISLATISLVASFALRLGMFPFHFWLTKDVIDLGMIRYYVVMPVMISFYLLQRWHPILIASPTSRTMLIALASFSAIVLAALSLVQTSGARVSRVSGTLICIAIVGMMFTDSARYSVMPIVGFTLAFAISFGLGRELRMSRMTRWVVTGVAALFFSGFLGQDQIVRQAWLAAQDASIGIPAVIGWILLAANGIAAYSCLELLSHNEDSAAAELNWSPLVSLVVGCAVVGLSLSIIQRPGLVTRYFEPLPLYGVISLVAVAMAFLVKQRKQVGLESNAGESSSLKTLVKRDFYIEPAIRVLFIAPVEMVGEVVSRANRLVFVSGPKSLFEMVLKDIDALSEQHPQRLVWIEICTLAMAIATIVLVTTWLT